jgi:hypothetical protein
VQLALYLLCLRGVEPRDHEIGFVGDDPLADRNNLRCGLALTKDHFGQPAPQRTMMIDLCEAQILEGQIAQLL